MKSEWQDAAGKYFKVLLVCEVSACMFMRVFVQAWPLFHLELHIHAT